MPTETGRHTRTIRGYLDELLAWPRWYIEREVDFSRCQAGGHYNEYLETCVSCAFGEACRWLDRHRTPSIEDATVDELTAALEAAVDYLQARQRSDAAALPAEARDWLRQAKRFLSGHRS